MTVEKTLTCHLSSTLIQTLICQASCSFRATLVLIQLSYVSCLLRKLLHLLLTMLCQLRKRNVYLKENQKVKFVVYHIKPHYLKMQLPSPYDTIIYKNNIHSLTNKKIYLYYSCRCVKNLRWFSAGTAVINKPSHTGIQLKFFFAYLKTDFLFSAFICLSIFKKIRLLE